MIWQRKLNTVQKQEQHWQQVLINWQIQVQSREYTKKIGEEEVERRVAYEVSVSKIDLVEDEE